MPSENLRRLNAFLSDLIRHPEKYGVTIEEAADIQQTLSDIAVLKLRGKF